MFGNQTAVGFYNTFSARKETEIAGVTLSIDAKTNEIHALKGEHYHSAQFHPESIMTGVGKDLLNNFITMNVERE